MVSGFRGLGFRGLRCRVGFRVWALVFKTDRSEKKTYLRPVRCLSRPTRCGCRKSCSTLHTQSPQP